MQDWQLKPNKTFCSLALVLLLQSIASGLYSLVILHIMLHQPGLSNKQFNLYFSNRDFGSGYVLLLSQFYIIIAPILGIMSDNYGRKKILLIAVASATLGYLLIYYNFNNSFVMIIGLFLVSISNIDMAIIGAAVADITHGKNRLWCFSLLQAIVIVYSLTVYVGRYFVHHYDSHHQLFFILLKIMIAVELLNLILIYYLIPETNRRVKEVNSIHYSDRLAEVASYFFQFKQVSLVIALLLTYFAWGIYYQYIYTYLIVTLHWRPDDAALFQDMKSILIVAMTFLINPWVINFIRYKRAFLYSLLLVGIDFSLCGIFSSSIAQCLIVVFLTGGIALLIPLFWYYFSEYVSPSRYGLMMALINDCWAIMWGASGIVASSPQLIQNGIPMKIVSIVGVCLLLVATSKRQTLNKPCINLN